MVRIFCSQNHQSNGSLCESCDRLLDYAFLKLKNCPYGVEKPACNLCPIHCYRKKEREEIRNVMRFSGPKMLRYHPFLAVMHLIDRRRSTPQLAKKAQKK